MHIGFVYFVSIAGTTEIRVTSETTSESRVQQAVNRGFAKDVASNTSAPGFDKVTSEQGGRRRLIWMFLIFLGFLAFIISFIVLLVRFLEHTIVIEADYSQPFKFPAVTICPTGPISYHKVCVNGTPLVPELNVEGRQVAIRMQDYWILANPEFENDTLNVYNRKVAPLTRKSLLYIADQYLFSRTGPELILDCEFDGKPCSYKDFQPIKMPGYHNCFTFNPPHEVSSDRAQGRLSIIISDIDRCVFGNDKETVEFVRGAYVAMHQPGKMPDLSNPVMVPTGENTVVHVQEHLHETINRKHHPCTRSEEISAHCMYYSNETVEMLFGYDEGRCQRMAQQKKINDKCGCILESLEAPCGLSAPSCHEIPIDSVLYVPKRESKAIGHLKFFRDGGPENTSMAPETEVPSVYSKSALGKLHERVSCAEREQQELSSVSHKEEKAECTDSCTCAKYPAVVTRTPFPASYTLGYRMLDDLLWARRTELEKHGKDVHFMRIDRGRAHATSSLRNMQQKFARLVVLPKEEHSTKFAEKVAYPTSAFISEIGGILGLWLGFSLMNILELLEVLVTRCFRRKNEQSEEK